ncbi:hypothetical protein [Streptomyces sp. S465]|uniref:hypothetical protein n=1 Tax=Streptomyces sp. S465 TaxID=2979468 RepID=UPI0022A8C7E5|nr:hypothetical protein [Streptomyces sp. S465]WAP54064.1 hypothetical protein N6H00_03290 [Streptomyces sp. S465]
MCVSMDRAAFSGTTVYAGRRHHPAHGLIHVLGYQNTPHNLADGPNAMLLHLPALPMTRENFLSAGRCQDILTRMVDAVRRCPVAADDQMAWMGWEPRPAVEVFAHDVYTVLKDEDRAPFAWVVDAHPEDIDLVDFHRPDGTAQKITMGDYRQLSDALFHAGADSGSQYEYLDPANRLHFYVLDLERDRSGVLSYTVAVRSLDGAGPQRRGLTLHRGQATGDASHSRAVCTFGLDNTTRATGGPAGAPATSVDSDVYRLSAKAVGRGWSAWLPNRLATARAGGSVDVEVAVAAEKDAARQGTVVLTARSESDPHRTAKALCRLSGHR